MIKTQRARLALVVGMALLGSVMSQGRKVPASEPPVSRILIVTGPSQHPPGTHEVAAGARVLKDLLEHAKGIGPVRVEHRTDWPADRAVLDDVATVVFTGDLFPGETLKNPARIKADLQTLTKRGCGIVCIHFATGLRAEDVSPDGDHPLLHWIGGYFAGGARHHPSVARICKATLNPGPVEHPVLKGWKAFSMEDEPYWNNFFGNSGPAANVTPLVTAMLPPEAPRKETVGWAIERPDGGRGMGIVVPHFYRNWQIDDLRTLILNGICWTAKMEIPAGGVKSAPPDLSRFSPAAVDPPGPKP